MSLLRWFEENASRFKGALLWNEPLSKHTYYRIGGPASLLIQPEALNDLELLGEGLSASQTPFVILGMGSNVLASDSGYAGVVIKTSKLNPRIEPESDRIRIGASVTVTTTLRHAGQQGWKGFELLAGIPGSIGGVVAMNAGTHLGEAKDLLVSADVFSLSSRETRTVIFDSLSFSYRKNHFLERGDVVFESVWRKQPGAPAAVAECISTVLQRRKTSQPLEFPSCGSVFKNPPGKRAWEVIDGLGLRGMRIGNAQISEKHPNFIVNLGDARAEDVLGLIELAKTEAKQKLSIELEEEVKLLGFS